MLSHCLKEVDLCRPYFVAFLGERYGWSQNKGAPEGTLAFTLDQLLQQTFRYAKEEYPWLDRYQNRSVTGILLH